MEHHLSTYALFALGLLFGARLVAFKLLGWLLREIF